MGAIYSHGECPRSVRHSDSVCGGLGLRDAGYYAIEAMRLEKGYRAMGHELDSAVTPRMTGLAFTVAGQKEKPFW